MKINVAEILREAYCVGMTQEPAEIEKLVDFIADLKPCNILEIGSDKGGTFYLWSRLASGKKITIDICGGPFSDLIDPEECESIATTMKTWAPDVHVIRGNSRDQDTIQRVTDILGGELLDFLFIDGDHAYVGIEADYNNYKDLVRRDGWIGFHDINDTPETRNQGCFVGPFWKELCGRKIEFTENNRWAGIGLIQKARS